MYPKSPKPLVSNLPLTDEMKEGRKEGRKGRKVETVLHHDLEELEDDFRARSNDHLAFAAFLRVVDVHQRVVQSTHQHHFDRKRRES